MGSFIKDVFGNLASLVLGLLGLLVILAAPLSCMVTSGNSIVFFIILVIGLLLLAASRAIIKRTW